MGFESFDVVEVGSVGEQGTAAQSGENAPRGAIGVVWREDMGRLRGIGRAAIEYRLDASSEFCFGDGVVGLVHRLDESGLCVGIGRFEG